jgi:hypothetical protein
MDTIPLNLYHAALDYFNLPGDTASEGGSALSMKQQRQLSAIGELEARVRVVETKLGLAPIEAGRGDVVVANGDISYLLCEGVNFAYFSGDYSGAAEPKRAIKILEKQGALQQQGGKQKKGQKQSKKQQGGKQQSVEPISGMVDFDANFLMDLTSDAKPNSGAQKDNDTDVIILAANAEGVVQFVTPAVGLPYCADVLKIAKQRPGVVIATAGVHPYWAAALVDGELREGGADCTAKAIDELRTHAKHTEVAFVGECGLDLSNGFPPLEAQLPWFEAQVKLACELRKPLFLHERMAREQFVEVSTPCPMAYIFVYSRNHVGAATGRCYLRRRATTMW